MHFSVTENLLKPPALTPMLLQNPNIAVICASCHTLASALNMTLKNKHVVCFFRLLLHHHFLVPTARPATLLVIPGASKKRGGNGEEVRTQITRSKGRRPRLNLSLEAGGRHSREMMTLPREMTCCSRGSGDQRHRAWQAFKIPG